MRMGLVSQFWRQVFVMEDRHTKSIDSLDTYAHLAILTIPRNLWTSLITLEDSVIFNGSCRLYIKDSPKRVYPNSGLILYVDKSRKSQTYTKPIHFDLNSIFSRSSLMNIILYIYLNVTANTNLLLTGD